MFSHVEFGLQSHSLSEFYDNNGASIPARTRYPFSDILQQVQFVSYTDNHKSVPHCFRDLPEYLMSCQLWHGLVNYQPCLNSAYHASVVLQISSH